MFLFILINFDIFNYLFFILSISNCANKPLVQEGHHGGKTMKFITVISFVMTLLVSMPTTVFASEGTQPENIPVQVESELINLNTADVKALQSLPGLGKTKAAAIISYREQFGEFASLSDLKKVKGIGDKVIAKLDGKVRF